jgi:hypothetical protein
MQKKGATFLSCVLHKISSLYAPSEIASQFPPPLRSNNLAKPFSTVCTDPFYGQTQIPKLDVKSRLPKKIKNKYDKKFLNFF